jgi:hypothetical protein
MKEQADKRASPRLPARIPLRVEGPDRFNKPFAEQTSTLLINQAGALIALGAELDLNDRITVTNQNSGKTAACRIAWRSTSQLNGRWSYGLALLEGIAQFWEEAKTAP